MHEGRHERELRPPLDVDKGTVVRALVAEHDEQEQARPLRAAAAFGDDIGDLPAFAALGELRTAPTGGPLTAVRVAAVDTREPAGRWPAAADLTVPGADRRGRAAARAGSTRAAGRRDAQP